MGTGDNRLKAVIFDWAGTLVDHGSLGPMGVFVDTFAGFGVSISIDEARQPMGLAKRAHVAALLAIPRIADEWRRERGALPTKADVDEVYERFVPANRAVAARFAEMIPGAVETAACLRQRGLGIGTTTGYTRDIMAEITPVAAAQGFVADAMACTGDAPDGRPTPLLIYRVLLDLGIWPSSATIKVDDTEVGIAEGLNAGCWTVGVAVTGNLFGLSSADLKALGHAQFAERRAIAAGKLLAAGAHFVIDGIADLLPVVDAVEGKLVRGERP